MRMPLLFPLLVLTLGACAADGAHGRDPADAFQIETLGTFDRPWAMAFLPDGRLLVTEKGGTLLLTAFDGSREQITGVPAVDEGGQGGLGDVALHPDFSDNGLVYLSYAEAGDEGTRGAAVARARLDLDAGALQDLEVIWRQAPKVSGRGHYGHRLLFDDEGYLFISSGERQKFTPAQDLEQNLGKIIRLHDDGRVPADNPLAAEGGVTAQIWSLGQRNPLGIAFDAEGRLWEVEMGPAGGDELNLIMPGKDYGYPSVSNGDHYSGKEIPDHDTRPEFEAPRLWWTPVISPGGMIIYSGRLEPAWAGNAFIAGLSSKALVRVALEGEAAREAERFAFGVRIRAVVEGPEGAIYLLEDGSGGALKRLTPKAQLASAPDS